MPGHEGDDACAKCHGTGRAGEKPCNASVDAATKITNVARSHEDPERSASSGCASSAIAKPSALPPELEAKLAGMMAASMDQPWSQIIRRASSLTTEWQRERALEVVERMVREVPYATYQRFRIADVISMIESYTGSTPRGIDAVRAAILSVVLAVIEEKP